MIYCDTREQKNGHVLEYFRRSGIEYEVRKLDTADYMDPERPGVLVDRKRTLDELAANLCTADSGRFWREIRRAHAEGAQLIVLCEHGRGVERAEHVRQWRSVRLGIGGASLARAMDRASLAYGVRFEFCERRDTGWMIAALLGAAGKERE